MRSVGDRDAVPGQRPDAFQCYVLPQRQHHLAAKARTRVGNHSKYTRITVLNGAHRRIDQRPLVCSTETLPLHDPVRRETAPCNETTAAIQDSENQTVPATVKLGPNSKTRRWDLCGQTARRNDGYVVLPMREMAPRKWRSTAYPARFLRHASVPDRYGQLTTGRGMLSYW